jgi:hypothetical protein
MTQRAARPDEIFQHGDAYHFRRFDLSRLYYATVLCTVE